MMRYRHLPELLTWQPKFWSMIFHQFNYYEGQDIKDLTIEDQDWNFLMRLKRQPDKSAFYYWYQTVQLLTTINFSIISSS
jgi:hypothetical protein